MRRNLTLSLYALPLLLCLLVFITGACGTLELGVEEEITATVSYQPTLAALQAENARLSTQVADIAAAPAAVNLGKVAFIRGGDIWVKELPDGDAQRLTVDGKNSSPRWSPSGEWLAFLKGGDLKQLWLMRADGDSARSLAVLPQGEFAWSPNQDRIAYVDIAGLQLVGATEELPTPLVVPTPTAPPVPEQSEIGHLSWSHDGQWIAYEWQKSEPEQPLSYQGLWQVPASGGKPVELYNSNVPEKGPALIAAWTGDDRYLLFWQGEILSASLLADGVPLYAVPVDGGEAIPVTGEDMVLVHDSYVDVSLDGEAIAVTIGSGRQTWGNKRIASVGISGTADGWHEPTYITPEDVAALSPAISPDNTHVAYSAALGVPDLVGGDEARQLLMQRSIYVTDGTETILLTDGSEYRDEMPLWSADGSHILFARLSSDGQASLWLVPASGGDPVQVVEELTPAPEWFGYYGYIAWDALFDWWSRPMVEPEPLGTATLSTSLTPTPPPAAIISSPPLLTPATTKP